MRRLASPPLLWGLVSFGLALLISAAAMSGWCRWDEFGLNRLPGALPFIVLLSAAAISGLVAAIRRRTGDGGVAFAVAVGLALGPLIWLSFLQPRCP
jgi:hypothetical protein